MSVTIKGSEYTKKDRVEYKKRGNSGKFHQHNGNVTLNIELISFKTIDFLSIE